MNSLVGFVLLLFRRFFHNPVMQRIDAGVAFELLVLLRIERVAQFGADFLVDCRKQCRVDFLRVKFFLGLARRRHQLLQERQ